MTGSAAPVNKKVKDRQTVFASATVPQHKHFISQCVQVSGESEQASGRVRPRVSPVASGFMNRASVDTARETGVRVRVRVRCVGECIPRTGSGLFLKATGLNEER